MILPLFIFLIALAFGLIVLGRYSEVAVYSILGFFLMFILGIYLINNDINYNSGEIQQLEYTTYLNDTVQANKTITNTYTAWDGDKLLGLEYKLLIGLYLAISSIMGFISIITQQKTRSIYND